LTPSLRLKVISDGAFSFSGLKDIVIPATIRIVEKSAFSSCDSLKELHWARGSKVKVIEEEAFENTLLKNLEIPGSLQYIGARICPATTELLLTRSSAMMPMFQEWKALFVVNRNEVMGRRTGDEMEDGDEGEDGEEGESESRKRCMVM
jgi:hypothetical protein